MSLGQGKFDHSKQIVTLSVVGKKPGLVVREEDSRPRGCGFESRRILEGCKRC